MKNAWKSLRALLSDNSELLADENDDQDKGKDAAKKAPAKKDESDGESDDDDDDDEDKDAKKKDKKKAETDSETGENKAETANMVHLALDDYTKLIALASTAKDATAENKKLKAKADEWDNYQAALSGTKPGADTAGAKAEDQKNDSTDPDAGLRAKYGSLMEDC